jgi:hypothetical protein
VDRHTIYGARIGYHAFVPTLGGIIYGSVGSCAKKALQDSIGTAPGGNVLCSSASLQKLGLRWGAPVT